MCTQTYDAIQYGTYFMLYVLHHLSIQLHKNTFFFFINATSKNTIKKNMTKQKQAALMSSLASIFNSTSTLFTMDIWRHWRPGFTLIFLFFFFLFLFVLSFLDFQQHFDALYHGHPAARAPWFLPLFFLFFFFSLERNRAPFTTFCRGVRGSNEYW